MKRSEYEKELRKLQVRLCHLQEWVKEAGLRVVIIFEGRDGAGKGGTIRALTERVSPRVFRVLRCRPPPIARSLRSTCSDTCSTFLPPAKSSFSTAAGTTAPVSNTSWASVRRKSMQRFLELAPQIEKFFVDGGVILIKLWMEVSNQEQKRRFEARIEDPVRQWKLSPDGSALAAALVRLFACPGLDVEAHRYPSRPVVHRSIGR